MRSYKNELMLRRQKALCRFLNACRCVMLSKSRGNLDAWSIESMALDKRIYEWGKRPPKATKCALCNGCFMLIVC
jgi:hypothetical protein